MTFLYRSNRKCCSKLLSQLVMVGSCFPTFTAQVLNSDPVILTFLLSLQVLFEVTFPTSDWKQRIPQSRSLECMTWMMNLANLFRVPWLLCHCENECNHCPPNTGTTVFHCIATFYSPSKKLVISISNKDFQLNNAHKNPRAHRALM